MKIPNGFVLLTASLLLIPLQNSSSANLIPNSDFEKTSAGNVDGWSMSGPSVGSNASTDAGFAEGKTSLHLKHQNAEYQPKLDTVIVKTPALKGVEAGKEYTFSFFAKAPNAGQKLRVYFSAAGEKGSYFNKSQDFILTQDWTKYEYTNRYLEKKDVASPRFYIRIDLPYGEAFLDQVSLDPSTKSANSPFGLSSRKNLLNNPGFELGWIGWMFRIQDSHEDTSNTGVPGTFIDYKVKHQGNASLKMEPNITVSTQRYPFQPGEKYTASFWARGEHVTGSEAKLKVYLMDAGETAKYLRKEFVFGKDIGPEWKRYSITFSFPDEGMPYRNTSYLRLDSVNAEFWIDDVQLEKGDKETDYECGLQAGIVTESKTGIFNRGKPENVKLVVNGTGGIPTGGVTLNMTARDGASNVLWQGSFSLSQTADEVISNPYQLNTDKLGVTEVSLELKKGNESISVNRFRYCVIDGTLESTRINPLFGLEVYRFGPGWMQEYCHDMCQYAGSGFEKMHFWWAPQNDPNGKLAEVQKDEIARMKKRGKVTLGWVSQKWPGTPKIAARAKWDVEPGPEEIAKEASNFGTYCGMLAKNFGDVTDYFFLLGEINIWKTKGGKLDGTKVMPPERAVQFIKEAAEQVHKNNSHTKLTSNVNGLSNFDYMEGLFKAGVAKYVDVFTVDAYQATPESPGVFENVKRLRSLIDKYAKGMPLMNTEQYFGVRDLFFNSQEADHDYFADNEEDHAGRLLQTYLHYIAADQAPFCVFRTELTLFQPGGTGPTHFYFSYGGYRFMSQTLYDIVSGSSPEINASIRTFLFERKDGQKIVTLNTKAYGKKGGLRETGADEAFDFNGNKLDPKDVPIGYLPVYLMYKGNNQEILGKLQSADVYGIDSPIRAAFDVEKQGLTVNVENASMKPINGKIAFNRMPSGWKTPDAIELANFESKATKKFAFNIPETTFEWDKDYSIDYTVSTTESIVTRTTRLPSIFAINKTINVDGNLDDWNGVKFITIGEHHIVPNQANYKGPQDLSATAAVTWDANNIYLAVNVKDDKVVTEATVRKHQNDSVQVYFDMQDDQSDYYDANDSVHCIYVEKGKAIAYLEKAPTGRYVGADNQTEGVDDEVKVQFNQTKDGYIIEAAFPKTALPMLNIKEGAKFGFSLIVNDNDGNGGKQGLTLGYVSPYNKPKTWKTIRLINN